jgi:pyruvate dehydrogenase E1 component alpha subunit
VARARAGGGPTLVECVTYRLGPHTTADDPVRYRSAEELAAWERKDPLTRFSAYLRARGLIEEGLEQAIAGEIEAAVARFEAAAPPDPLRIFDHAYGQLPPDVQRQRAAMAAWLGDGRQPPAMEAPVPPSPPMRGQRAPRS